MSPEIFYDTDGLIVHRNLDGGDTGQREGWYWFGVWIRQNVLNEPWPYPRKLEFRDVIKLLEPNGNGVFYRHPKIPPYNEPFNSKWGTSRDQLVPLIAAMGVWEEAGALKRLWEALPRDPIGAVKHSFNGEFKRVLANRLFTPATLSVHSM